MNILKNSKFYFSDLLELDIRINEKSVSKELVLEKIDELSEKTSESISVQIPEEPVQQVSFTEIPLSQPKSSRYKFLDNFLIHLSKHPKIYTYLTTLALRDNLLKPRKTSTIHKPRSKNITLKNNNPSLIPTENLDSYLTTDEENSSSSLIDHELKNSKSTHKRVILKPNYTPDRFTKETLKSSSSSAITFHPAPSSARNRIRALRKRLTLKSEDSVISGIFKKISEGRIRITPEDFKKYLNLRYPLLISETIAKYFNFKYWTYEDYIYELSRFITLGEERHLAFCFEIFDFDKDQLITYKDTFTAMEIRTGNHYDSDLVLIREMFNLKKREKIYKKGGRLLRRRSTFSLIEDKAKNTSKKPKENQNPKRYKSQPREKPEETPSINFKEFCIIKFYGRPQIIQDFFLYTCNYNFLQAKGYIEKTPIHSVKNSETIVIEMNLDSQVLEKVSKSDKYEYYCALDTAMGLFVKSKLEDLMKKFKHLQSSEKLKYTVISRKSMVEKLPSILGYKNDYLSSRFYDYLSQGKDLTKACFLLRIHSLISKQTTLIINKLAFDIYDFRNDGKLTVDEIYKMNEALPQGSLVYQECNVMVSMYIQSIFERLREKLKFIDFVRFNEIVGVSYLGIEIIDFLKTPYEECLARKSEYFEIRELTEEEVEKYSKAKKSLARMLV
ncbi:hypothetical protein SteCoe_34274 [Stentor coeruleus]|uniref:EF-hand domain-containing protein n=1 Tax=Stentor coeruleus TaxID=5963 RepID=A0A1R2AV33_9CILI|nr:hypothetical protein SteCoe_34274 [Stentor coeruleus]